MAAYNDLQKNDDKISNFGEIDGNPKAQLEWNLCNIDILTSMLQ